MESSRLVLCYVKTGLKSLHSCQFCIRGFLLFFFFSSGKNNNIPAGSGPGYTGSVMAVTVYTVWACKEQKKCMQVTKKLINKKMTKHKNKNK